MCLCNVRSTDICKSPHLNQITSVFLGIAHDYTLESHIFLPACVQTLSVVTLGFLPNLSHTGCACNMSHKLCVLLDLVFYIFALKKAKLFYTQ